MPDIVKMLEKTAEMKGCFFAEVRTRSAIFDRCVCRDNGEHGVEVWHVKKGRGKKGKETRTVGYEEFRQDDVIKIRSFRD